MKVTNWEEWQSYRKDRGQPPWIKVHRRIMRNEKWIELSDAQRGQLLSIWLLAADHNGEISDSPKLVQKICFMSSKPDLQLFVKLGFIEHDAKTTPERRQHDQPEESRVDKSRVEEKKPAASRPQDFLEALKTNPAYQHIDFEVELGKMRAWQLLPKNRNRKFTQRFILNWLNGVEKPLSLPDVKAVPVLCSIQNCGKPWTSKRDGNPLCGFHAVIDFSGTDPPNREQLKREVAVNQKGDAL